MERAQAQAAEFGHSVQREMAYLAVHSVLHLLGYDHLDEGPQKKQMRSPGGAILAELASAVASNEKEHGMKTFLGAWFGTLILGYGLLFVIGMFFDSSMAFLLFGVTVIALLITLIAGLYEDLDKLNRRLDRLEGKTPPEEPAPVEPRRKKRSNARRSRLAAYTVAR